MIFFPADITLREAQSMLSVLGWRFKSDRRGYLIVVPIEGK